MMLPTLKKLTVSLLFMVASFESYAGIVIGGTRVIYNSDKKEASVSIHNPDNSPFLIQSWLNADSDSNQQSNDLPFIITPPLFRLNADTTNALRIVKTKDLPNNRESVYWLNIKAIPTSNPNAKNELNISVNSRIKLFYRPASLNSQDAAVSYKSIIFSRTGQKLFAHNPTPYYISLNELSVNGNKIPNPGMIAPMGEQLWDMPTKITTADFKVNWSSINDFGGETPIATQMP